MGDPETAAPPQQSEGSPAVSPARKPVKKHKKGRWSPKGKTMQRTKMDPKTFEELLPEVVPKTVIQEGVKTAKVKLRTAYWPMVPVENGDRLLAGSIVELPIDEAKMVVGRGAGDLQFE